MNNLYRWFFQQNVLSLLIFYSTIFLLFNLVETQILVTEEHYIETLSKTLDNEAVEKFIGQRKKTVAVEVFFYLLEKWITVLGLAFLLYVSVFAFDIKIAFSDFFKMVLIAHYTFIIMYLLKLLWFLFIQKDFTLYEFTQFVPLSISNLFETTQFSDLIKYPLKFINIFDFLFPFVLGYGIFFQNHRSYKSAIAWAALSYFAVLALWVIVVTFLKVSF